VTGHNFVNLISPGTDDGRFEVWINIDHPNWSGAYTAQRTVGHESLHNIGLRDEPSDSSPLGYKRGYPSQQEQFDRMKNDPYYETITPELLMDAIYP
jgi:hypothetical protein